MRKLGWWGRRLCASGGLDGADLASDMKTARSVVTPYGRCSTRWRDGGGATGSGDAAQCGHMVRPVDKLSRHESQEISSLTREVDGQQWHRVVRG
uniref:Uncharacterized protein n=1 Tax=Oryza sativa subsp. japonica TaxID=39947 RepID=Q6H534_ORYSJ|nr:hypothetical protein [Oryza sativa Japonica Group]